MFLVKFFPVSLFLVAAKKFVNALKTFKTCFFILEYQMRYNKTHFNSEWLGVCFLLNQAKVFFVDLRLKVTKIVNMYFLLLSAQYVYQR